MDQQERQLKERTVKVNCRLRVPSRQERRISRFRSLLSPPAASVPVEIGQITTSRLVSIISPVRLHPSSNMRDRRHLQRLPNGVMAVVVLNHRISLVQPIPAASSTCFSLLAVRRPMTVVSTQVKEFLPCPVDGHPGVV